MKILALELSTTRGSLAWLDKQAEEACDWPNDRKNSSAFFENIDRVTKTFGAPDRIIVGLGPGSYAGTRIAISAAIGLQVASGATLIGYPSICAFANAAEYGVIGDARRKSFFFARVAGNDLIEGPTLFVASELHQKIDSGFQTCWANRLEGYVPLINETELSLLGRNRLRRAPPQRNRRARADRFSRDALGCESQCLRARVDGCGGSLV
jgi:tRNA threonylcarbamoyl adenosine modification protein YeaZ